MRCDMSESKNAEKVRVGVGSYVHPFGLSFFDWRLEVEKMLLSLIGLKAPGRPVRVFCNKCCVAKNVCCEVT